jgi:hypothetical protein
VVETTGAMNSHKTYYAPISSDTIAILMIPTSIDEVYKRHINLAVVYDDM